MSTAARTPSLMFFADNFREYQRIANIAWADGNLDRFHISQIWHKIMLESFDYVPPEAFTKIAAEALKEVQDSAAALAKAGAA